MMGEDVGPQPAMAAALERPEEPPRRCKRLPAAVPSPLGRLLADTQDYLRGRAGGLAVSAQQEAAWRRFYDAASHKIFVYACRCGASREELVECTQEVWHELLVRLPRFELDVARGQFETWLFRVVRTKVIDLFRLRRCARVQASGAALRDLADARPSADRAVADRELVRLALARLRHRLSACTYQVLRLRLVEQLSVAEVAAALGLTGAQVWYRFHRARRILADICRLLADESPPRPGAAVAEEMVDPQKSAQAQRVPSVSRDDIPSPRLGPGGDAVDFVFKRMELGRRSLIPEWKVEWNYGATPAPVLFIRKLSIVAYAEICAPEEILSNHWPRVVHAAVAAGVAAGIATIIATPTAALPVFRAEFKKHLQSKTGTDFGDDIHVALSAGQEPNGPWCLCND